VALFTRRLNARMTVCGGEPPGKGVRLLLKSPAGVPVESPAFPIIVASIPPGAKQRRAAIAVVIVFAIVAGALAPFANVQAPRVDAFIPVIQTVICVVDLVTAVLLFSQYSLEPRPAILAVASGYMASGLFAFLQTLAFPGGYAPTGIIGDGRDSSAWLFVFWHTCFPMGVLVYALLKGRPVNRSGRPAMAKTIGATVAAVLVAFAALSWLATAGTEYLPGIYVGGYTQQTVVANLLNLFMWLWGSTALIVLFLRRGTVLDLWLIVTLCAWMPNFVAATVMTTFRFSVGWYMARGFALIASCTVLTVLLTETTLLYARLANMVVLLRRERSNRLMSLDAATAAMAHELRQPLLSITASAAAAGNWLNKVPPEIDEVRDCIALMSSSAQSADDIIAGVRELFKDSASNRTEVRIADIVRHDLSLVKPDLQAAGIRVETELQADLPAVHADRTQLQQVVLNLIRNAIEAMVSTVPGARRLRLAARLEGSSVVLSVQDTGPGIAAKDAARVFEPFFTTKLGGMGLGLAICKTIAQDHGGDLRLAQSGPGGCVFEIVLQTAAASYNDSHERHSSDLARQV
jgi:signal transduction histidine kinase